MVDECQSLAVVDSFRQVGNNFGVGQPPTRLFHALPQEITLIVLPLGGLNLEMHMLRSRV